jgi:hypothetical protein
MPTLRETFERYDSAYLIERRALGDELSDEAHAAIEAVLRERGEAVPSRPVQPVRLAAGGRTGRSTSFGRIAVQCLLVFGGLVAAKMLAHSWIGLVFSVVMLVVFAVDWHRKRKLTPAERESSRQAKVAERDGMSELMRSAADGDLVRVADLLRFGADVNERNLRGATALMYAARNNQLEVARALMDAGARPNLQSDAKATALSIAVQHGHQPVADLLRQRGAMLPGGH